jgi:hypothetical protein
MRTKLLLVGAVLVAGGSIALTTVPANAVDYCQKTVDDWYEAWVSGHPDEDLLWVQVENCIDQS